MLGKYFHERDENSSKQNEEMVTVPDNSDDAKQWESMKGLSPEEFARQFAITHKDLLEKLKNY